MGGMRPSQDYDVRVGPPERTVRFQEVRARQRARWQWAGGTICTVTDPYPPVLQGKLFLGGLDETITTRDINEYCSQW